MLIVIVFQRVFTKSFELESLLNLFTKQYKRSFCSNGNKIETKLFERFGFKSTQVLAGDNLRGGEIFYNHRFEILFQIYVYNKRNLMFEVSNEHEKSNYILSVVDSL